MRSGRVGLTLTRGGGRLPSVRLIHGVALRGVVSILSIHLGAGRSSSGQDNGASMMGDGIDVHPCCDEAVYLCSRDAAKLGGEREMPVHVPEREWCSAIHACGNGEELMDEGAGRWQRGDGWRDAAGWTCGQTVG